MEKLEIKELETILSIYEDVNLYASLIDRINQFIAHKIFTDTKIPLAPEPGSELSKNGWLAKPLKNYATLRNHLEHKPQTIDSEIFLPNVPQRFQPSFSKIGLVANGALAPILSAPFFFADWVKHKSVVTLDEHVSFDGLSLVNEIDNYLAYLPYETFLVSLPKAHSINLASLKRSFTFSKFICLTSKIANVENSKVLHVFCINENIEQWKFSYVERLKIKELLKCNDKKFRKNVPLQHKFIGGISAKFSNMHSKSCLDFAFLVKSGNIMRMNNEDAVVDVFDLFNFKSERDNIISVFVNVFRKMLMHINALGKMFYESTYGFIDPAELRTMLDADELQTTLEKDPSEQTTSKSFTMTSYEKLKWNEVAGEHVCYVKTKKIRGKNVSMLVSGAEKMPHIRRGHVHHYRRADGSLEKKWLKPILVRKDKVEKVGVHGSPLLVKN